MQHAGVAVDEVRRAEFFRKGGAGISVSFIWDVLKGAFHANWLATLAFPAIAVTLTLALRMEKLL